VKKQEHAGNQCRFPATPSMDLKFRGLIAPDSTQAPADPSSAKLLM
jgi:hypothetical protein